MDKTDHAVCVVSMACGVNWLLEAYTVQCPVASEHLLVARCMPGTSVRLLHATCKAAWTSCQSNKQLHSVIHSSTRTIREKRNSGTNLKGWTENAGPRKHDRKLEDKLPKAITQCNEWVIIHNNNVLGWLGSRVISVLD